MTQRGRRMRRIVAGLPRRVALTLRHQGPAETLRRALAFPLRLRTLRLLDATATARAWYAEHGRRVAVVIPTFGDPALAARAVDSVRQTSDPARVRIIVTDDGSAPEHVERLRALAGTVLIEGAEPRGFAANCNRGIAAAAGDEDVVLLNSDVVAEPGWLEALQHAAYEHDAAATGARLLYPDGSIQSAGTMRRVDDPDWFDHRFRGRNAELPQATVMQPVLAVTGACMYLRRDALDAIGPLDEAYEMAFEDVDWCLRAWEAGYRVLYVPAAVLVHDEARTRGRVQGDRELRSQALFWERWGDWFDKRDMSTPDGRLRVVFAGGGGDMASALAARGHDAQLWSVGDRQEGARMFASWDDLRAALAPLPALKVATTVAAAEPVWEASVTRGVPVCKLDRLDAAAPEVYRPEFRFLAATPEIAENVRAVVGPWAQVALCRDDADDVERNLRAIADADVARR